MKRLDLSEKKIFLTFSILMGIVIISSNYLVQYPINHFNLNEILTSGAFTYPVTFLITDLANRRFGKNIARTIVYFGFMLGILLTTFVSTNFENVISIRIAIGSGTAFIIAQLIDIEIFQFFRFRRWFVAPITSSIFGSIIDTFLFFSIAFLGTEISWVSLAFGDLSVKLLIALLMLIPFRLLIIKLKDISDTDLKAV